MNIRQIWTIFSLFLLKKVVKSDKLGVIVNRTEIQSNYEFVNTTVELKLSPKSYKYGIDINVDLRKPIDDVLVCIL